MKPAVRIGAPAIWIGVHAQRSRLVMGGAETVMRWPRDRLTGRKNRGDAHHRIVHRRPQIAIPLRRRYRHRSPPHPVLVGTHIEIDPARMRTEVARVCRLHLAQPTDRYRHMGIRRAAQLVVEIDIGYFAVELVFAADGATTAAGS